MARRKQKLTKTDDEEIDGYWLDCDFINGACDAFENGKQHLKISELIASHRVFGYAVSHIILGIEELIKALVLVFLNSDRYFISHSNKEKLFANHGYKHINIKDFLFACTSHSINDYNENWFSYYIDGLPDNKFRQKVSIISRLLNPILIERNEIERITELLLNANNLKNKGFYVDYDGMWIKPDEIDEVTYNEYMRIGQVLMGFIEPLFTTSLTDNDELIEFLYGK